MSIALKAFTSVMFFYSLMFLTYKVIDFSDINKRLDKFEDIVLARPLSLGDRDSPLAHLEKQQKADKFKTLYYESNILMLIVSVFAVLVEGFIVYTIRKNLSITKSTLNRIAMLAFSIIVTFFVLLIKFVATLMLYLGQSLK